MAKIQFCQYDSCAKPFERRKGGDRCNKFCSDKCKGDCWWREHRKRHNRNVRRANKKWRKRWTKKYKAKRAKAQHAYYMANRERLLQAAAFYKQIEKETGKKKTELNIRKYVMVKRKKAA